MRAAIYADEAGEPGLLLASTNAVTIEADDESGWRAFSLPTPLELSAGDYWLTLHSGREAYVVEYYYEPAPEASRVGLDGFDDGADALFGAGDSVSTRDRQISIYATFDDTTPPTLGRAAIGSLQTGLRADAKRGTRYNLALPRTVNALRAYLRGAGGTGTQAVSAAIYSDVGGEPARLLGATNALTVDANDEPAWRDFRLASSLPLPAGDYWLVLHASGDGFVGEYYYDPAAERLRWTYDTFEDGPSAVFAATDPVGTRDRELSIHATYLDTTPPAPPIAFTAVRTTATRVDTAWAPASDDVGVAAYDLYVDGAFVGSTTSISQTFAGLRCETAYTVEVAARDAAGNRSARTALIARTGACTYYVSSSTGSDSNDGLSPSAPWRSLARVNEAAFSPGARVRFRRGDRWEGVLEVRSSGTDLQPIVLDAYDDGARPLVTHPTADRCVEFHGDFVVARNLHIDGCMYGLAIFGNDALVERSTFTDNAEGLRIEPGSLRATVTFSEFRENNRMVVNTPGGDDDYGAMGMIVGGDDVEVHHNTFSGHSAASYDYGRDGAAIEVFEGQRGWYHHNLAIDNDVFAELGHARSADNTFSYNVVRGSIADASFLETRGVGSFGPVYRTSAFNNSVYLTGPLSSGIWCANCAANVLKLRNNAIKVTDGYAIAGADEDYNIFAGSYVNGTLGPHSRRADPLFVSPSDLRLQATSPAIDAGTDVGALVDFDGSPVPLGLAPDIGAYEVR